MKEKDYPYNQEQELQQYKGHKIPFVIKLAWVILILWGCIYSVMYAFPDLGQWLNK